MSKFGVMVMGPAGAGKSTFCGKLITHLTQCRRSSFYINLDPAAETFAQSPNFDIRELITVNDVMSELGFGPNGALIYCFQYLLDNMELLTERLESLTEEYLIIFDMPGQIELYSHMSLIPNLVRQLSRAGNLDMRLCAAYLLESTFMIDRAKFFAGAMAAMSAMMTIELPHINIFSKMDLVKGMVNKHDVENFCTPTPELLDDDPSDIKRKKAALAVGKSMADADEEEASMDVAKSEAVMKGASFRRLNRKVAALIEEFGIVNFLEFNPDVEGSIGDILSYIDNSIQWAEAQEPREPHDEMEYDDDE